MFLACAGLLFAIFSLNVAIGSFTGTPFIGDVGEMLLLFATSVAFVAAILRKEAAVKRNDAAHES